MVFSPNKLLMTIRNGKEVIFVDSKSQQVLSEIALQDKPRFVCMTNVHLAATTMENKQIQFIKVNESTLQKDSTLNVDDEVIGMAVYRNNLVVTYDLPGVKILSNNATVIHKLDNTAIGREVFKNPDGLPQRLMTPSM